MIQTDIAEIRSRFDNCSQILKDLQTTSQDQSEEDEVMLSRIAQKLADLEKQIAAAHNPTAGAPAKNKVGRMNRLREMQSAMASMMTALKSAR